MNEYVLAMVQLGDTLLYYNDEGRCRQALESFSLKKAENNMPEEERKLTVTAIDDRAAEYHLNLPESVVRDLLDRTVPPFFIEIPVPSGVGSCKHHYLQSSKIARLMLHGELS